MTKFQRNYLSLLLVVLLILISCSKASYKGEDESGEIIKVKTGYEYVQEQNENNEIDSDNSVSYDATVVQTINNDQKVISTRLNSWNNNQDYYEIVFSDKLKIASASPEFKEALTIKPSIKGKFVFKNGQTIRFEPSENFSANTNYRVTLKQNLLFDEELPKIELSFYNSTPSLNLGTVSLIPTDNNKLKVKINIDTYNGTLSDQEFMQAVKLELDRKKVDLDKIERQKNNNIVIYSKDLSATSNTLVTVSLNNKYSKIRNRSFTNRVSEMRKLRLYSLRTETSTSGKVIVYAEFSKELKKNQVMDGLVKVYKDDKLINCKISKYNSKLNIIGNFERNQKYKVVFTTGIKADDGSTLPQEESRELQTYNIDRSVAFNDKGIFLSSDNDNAININVTNYSKIRYNLYEIPLQNFAEMIHNIDIDNMAATQSNNQYALRNIDWFGALIKSETIELDKQVDKKLNYKLELADKIEKDKNKVLILSVEGLADNKDNIMTSNNYWYYNGSSSKMMILSDYSVSAKTFDNSINIKVSDILTLDNISNAEVVVKTNNNIIYGKGRTNSQGFVKISNKDLDLVNNGFFITVSKKDKFGFLESSSMYIDDTAFDIQRDFSDNSTKFKVFLDRIKIRPGEDVNITCVIRDENNELVNSDIPTTITIYDNQGNEFLKDKLTNGKSGMLSYRFSTEVTSETGTWAVEVSNGPKKERLSFNLEEFVPDKIDVEISTDKDYYMAGDRQSTVTVDNKYLFGSPLVGNDCNISFQTSINNRFAYKKFSDYDFISSTNFDFNRTSPQIRTIKTDDQGIVSTTFDLINASEVSSPYFITVEAKTSDDGGRVVSRKKTRQVFPNEYFIGLYKDQYLKKKDGKFKVPLVVLDYNEKKVSKALELEYRVYAKERNWWLSSWEADQIGFKSSESTKKIAEGVLTNSKNNVIEFELIDENLSEFLVEVNIKGDTSSVMSKKYYDWYWNDNNDITEDTSLEIKTDKPKYEVGEEVKISVPSSKGSKILINIIKKDNIIYSEEILAKKNGKFVYKFETTKEMIPNVYCEVKLIQAKNAENDLPQRLYGIVPVTVYSPDTYLDIKLDHPETVKSKSSFKCTIDVGKAGKSQYIVSVVDEGLLNSTNYSIPNIWKHFYKQEGYMALDYDNMMHFIDAKEVEIFRNILIGGDYDLEEFSVERSANVMALSADGGHLRARGGSMAKMIALQSTGVNRFKPVSYFYGVLETNEDGIGEIEVDVPDYLGSLRIDVVACQDKAFGKKSSRVIVSEELTVIPSLPRVLFPGDHFIIPVSVITSDQVKEDITVEIICNDLSSIKGKSSKTIALSDAKKQTNFSVKVGDNFGKATYEIVTKSGKYENRRFFEVGVRQPSPYLFESDPIELTDNKTSVKITEKGLAGNSLQFLTFEKPTILDANKLIRYSVRYPYGCAEQRTSNILTQILLKNYISDVNQMSAIDANVQRYFDNIVNYNDNGLWYWKNKSSHREIRPALNAYALHTFILARENGYSINEFIYDEVLKYLKTLDFSGTRIDFDEAYVLYVLALADNADISRLNYLNESKEIFVDSNATSMLMLAYNQSNIRLKSVSDLDCKVTVRVRDKAKNILNPNLEIVRAINLLNNIINSSNKNEANSIAKNIVANLRNPSWGNTYSKAWSLLAYDTYKEKYLSRNSSQDAKYLVKVGDESLEIDLKDEAVNIIVSNYLGQDIEIEQLSGVDDNLISLNKYFIEKNEDIEDYSKTLSLVVNYKDDENNIVNVKNLKQGETFFVELEVSSQVSNLETALIYSLPSGWEFVEEATNSNNESYQSIPQTRIRDPWDFDLNTKSNKGTTDYIDVRDDRLIAYATTKKNSKITVKKEIRAISVGKYQIPATTVEDMYNSRNRALITNPVITVRKK